MRWLGVDLGEARFGVDFEWVWVGSELICVRCLVSFRIGFGALPQTTKTGPLLA